MITVACVEWSDYCGAGSEYVAILRDMVARHLKAEHRFVCLTDAPERHPGIETIRLTPGPEGWWAKCELFRSGLFDGRILYLDLDSVIVGPLDPLAASPGIIQLADWGWTTPTYGSGVMVWDAAEHAEIWTRWTPEVAERLRGDQDWLTELGGWQALPAHLCRSYRYESKAGPPKGCSVVCMHGRPKCHELPAPHWSRAFWRRG